MMRQNVMENSIVYLKDCGYTEDEAKNLISALRSESKEKLLNDIESWIKHVGEHKKYQTCLLDLVAIGCLNVDGRDSEGNWLFSLKKGDE